MPIGYSEDEEFDKLPPPKWMSESPDSDPKPHVHKVSEAHQWWADCFPQHTRTETTMPTIPQSFIDDVQLQTDEIIQTVKDRGPDGISTEELALIMFDKRGMISDLEQRQALAVMVAILLKRVSNA